MRRHLYRFNPETCTFERVSVQPRSVLRNLGLSAATGVLLSLAYLSYCLLTGDHVENRLQATRGTTLTHQVASLDSGYTELLADLQQLHQNDNAFYRSILDLEKVDPAAWQGGTGGNDRYAALKPEVRPLALTADQLMHQVNLQMESYATLEQAAIIKVEKLVHMPVIRPVPGRIVGGFGMRRDPFHGRPQMHFGLDFDGNHGGPVKATGNGTVITAGRNGESGYGIQIEIDHGFGYVTKYAHLSKVLVQEGQTVKRGDLIGRIGNTGYSTGPHLHYEVIYKGRKLNPNDYFLSGY